MTGALRGARVLIPRDGSWGARVAAEVDRRGGIPIVAPLIASAPPRDEASRDRAFAALAAGDYSWLFVTSAASVEQLRLVVPKNAAQAVYDYYHNEKSDDTCE